MKHQAAVLLLLFAGFLTAQQTSSFPTQLADMLHRNADGHSPTDEEIRAAENTSGLTDPAVAHTMLPLLTKGLASTDTAMRQFTLGMLVGMQTLPDPSPAAPPAAATAPTAPAPRGVFKPEVADQFAPLAPAIAARLLDESPENRELTAVVLGGFAPNPPAAFLPPLYSFLKRDDAVGPIGLAVVIDLLEFSPAAPASVTAISQYLNRRDQPVSAQTELIEAIAAEPKQNQSVNKALLTYLDSDDPALRSRLILSLPQLDLAPDTYAETSARITQLANAGQDDLQVVTAAKAVAPCWTTVHMPTGCPAY